MSNTSAEQIYTDTFNMIENDNDILTPLEEKSNVEQVSLTKLKCLYTTDYMVSNGAINLNEQDSINKCICDNITE